MEPRTYLHRLSLSLGGEPSLEQLRWLHERHLLEVPFENLDIHRGVEIVLDEEWILTKIVKRKRGGFCYELNFAFGWLLRKLGYRVRFFSAEVARKEGGFGIPFDHMTLGVDLDGPGRAGALSQPDLLVESGPWLADVGFGESFRYPLPLAAGGSVEQLGEWYRLWRDGPWWILERRSAREGDFLPQYRFTLEPRELSDFASGCRYHQTSPRSTFTKGAICSKALPNGRVTLHPHKLVTTCGGVRTEETIRDQGEWFRALEKQFGIVF
jgi:N-hydroxyarylamine O-acetyltransferase